ncbi:hypothetical protein DPSP01_012282 [Paraphaeosphaeria sporulosa]
MFSSSKMADIFTPLRPKGNAAPRGEDAEPTQTNEATSPYQTAFQANDVLFYTASSDDNICARCRSLDRTSLSGPPFPLATPSVQFLNPSTELQPTLHEFLRESMRPSCTICVQLLQLLDIRGDRPDRLRIWWNQYRAAPGGSYVHSCRIDAPKGYYEEFSLVNVHVGAEREDQGRKMPRDTPDYAAIKRWLLYCHQQHPLCATAPNQSTPSLRVIDCKARSLTIIPPSCPYVALSYVWGIAGRADHPALHLPPTLPRTIEDAMEVALELDVGYLWVDRYCINQVDQEEKERLFAMMDVIYRNAELTIIAAAGNGPEMGLPGVRPGSMMPHEKVHVGIHSFSVVPLHHSELRRSKWNTRGWTYQEARLSLRRLLFLPSQLALQCPSSVHLSALHPTLADPTTSFTPTHTSYTSLAPFRHPISSQGSSFVWTLRTDLYTYYERELTYSSDALNAFQGVVNSYKHHAELKGVLAHFWGLHIFALPHLTAQSAFLAELAWFVVSRSGYFFSAPEQPAYSREVAKFPSWSWAGKMANDMSTCTPRTALRHKEREGRDPFEAGSSTRLALADDVAITFTHAEGRQVGVEEFVQRQYNYLSFHPSFSITAWTVKGSIRTVIPLDRHETFREEGIDGGYEELDLDYCVEWARGEGSVVVVFLGAWVNVDEVDVCEYDGDGYETGGDRCCDVHCLLCEEVASGTVRRFGLWSVGVDNHGEVTSTQEVLRSLLKMRVILPNGQWERRDIRLV